MLRRLALVCNIIGWLSFLTALVIGIGIGAGYVMQRGSPYGIYGIGVGALVGAGIGVSSALFWWVVAWIVRPRDGEDAISGRPLILEQWSGQSDGGGRVEPTILMTPEELAERRVRR